MNRRPNLTIANIVCLFVLLICVSSQGQLTWMPTRYKQFVFCWIASGGVIIWQLKLWKSLFYQRPSLLFGEKFSGQQVIDLKFDIRPISGLLNYKSVAPSRIQYSFSTPEVKGLRYRTGVWGLAPWVIVRLVNIQAVGMRLLNRYLFE